MKYQSWSGHLHSKNYFWKWISLSDFNFWKKNGSEIRKKNWSLESNRVKYSLTLILRLTWMFFWPVSARSYKIAIVGKNWLVGWLVDWLVCNAVISETALRIFLISCMKLGDYKGRKVTAGFLKKFLIWSYFCFWPEVSTKYDLQFETYFSEKFAIWRYLTSKSSKNCPDWGFWPFSRLWIISFPWFCT